MNEKTRKNIVYIIFVAALIYGGVSFLGPRGSSPTNPSAEAEMATIQPLATEGAKKGDIADKSEWGRDPFARSVKATKATEQLARLRLSAISGSAENPLAVINGKVVGAGETITGWEIVTISRNAVQLRKNGTSRTLTIGGS